MARARYLKIGKIRYALKEDQPIKKERYLRLLKHPQAHLFLFKSAGHGKLFFWYVQNQTGVGTKLTVKRDVNYSNHFKSLKSDKDISEQDEVTKG